MFFNKNKTNQLKDLTELKKELADTRDAYFSIKEKLDSLESKQQLLLAEIQQYGDQANLDKLRKQINNI